MPSQLARSLPLTIRGIPLQTKTPLLVPSFSSKALVDVDRLFEELSPSITESFLISAYDLHYSLIQLPGYELAEVVFLDSGGYEAAKDHDEMEPLYQASEANAWTIANYRDLLDALDLIMPTFITAFDHPTERRPIAEQINIAVDTFKNFQNVGREILFKPETHDQRLVPIRNLIAEIPRFSQFDIVGITETELGDSTLDRMASIARLRIAMNTEGVHLPLHIFGSLDPVCTPLYFLAGADIFDGLSWIRFSYSDDMAVYHKNHIPLRFGITDLDRLSLARSYDANLHYLSELKTRLMRYLLDGDENRLGRHGEFFAKCLDDLRVVVGKGV